MVHSQSRTDDSEDDTTTETESDDEDAVHGSWDPAQDEFAPEDKEYVQQLVGGCHVDERTRQVKIGVDTPGAQCDMEPAAEVFQRFRRVLYKVEPIRQELRRLRMRPSSVY